MKPKTFSFFLIAVLGLFLSCNNEDSPTPDGNENVDNEAVAIQLRLKRKMLLNNLCYTDSLEDGTLCYTPRHGEVLEEVTPTVRYIGVDSLVEAQNYFRTSLSLPYEQDEDVSEEEIYNVYIDNCHLEFKKSVVPGEYARVTIDCPELKDVLTEIVFIPNALWPSNDSGSPFAYGSLWKNNENGRYYICVRDCHGGKTGIMLTFDGGWSEDWFRKYDYHQDCPFVVYYNCASYDAFSGLTDLVLHQPTKFKKMVEKLNQQTTDSDTKRICNAILAGKWMDFNVGSHEWDKHLWWAHYCYDVTMNYFSLSLHDRLSAGETSRTKKWNKFYTHEDTPANGEPSSSFEFRYGYNKDNWAAIYR